MKINRYVMLTAAVLTLGLGACGKEPAGPAEKLGAKVNDALDQRPAEGVRDAAEGAGDAIKDAAGEVKDAVKDAAK